MNHRHRKILHSLFAHPISGNISPVAVRNVFTDLGADVEERNHSKMAVKLNGHTANFPRAGHSFSTDDVIHARKFVEMCGIDPERDYPL